MDGPQPAARWLMARLHRQPLLLVMKTQPVPSGLALLVTNGFTCSCQSARSLVSRENPPL